MLRKDIGRLTDMQVQSVRAQVEAILGSALWRRAPRQQRLLRHIVLSTLQDDKAALGGQAIARAVFDRGDEFDPTIDPIVRVEVGRLRGKLLAYYACEGLDAGVHIQIPKGAYRAQFLFGHHDSSSIRLPLADGIGAFWTLDDRGLVNAQESFARALQHDPQYAAAHAWLSIAAINRHAFAFDRSRRSLDLAQKHAQRAIDLDPRSAFARAAQCATFIWSTQSDRALETGQRAVGLDPNYPDGHAMLALALANSMRLDAALEEIEIALQLNPHPSGYFHWIRGTTLHLLKQMDKAKAAYEQGLSSSAFGQYNRIGLALCHVQAGELEEAAEQLRLFRQWYPLPDLAYRNRFSDATIRRHHAAAMGKLGFRELAE